MASDLPIQRALPGRLSAHLLGALGALLLTIAAASGVRAQGGEQRAGVVVQYGDGSVATACVRFSEPELDGIALLERSGLPVITQTGGVGAAVCKIGPDGCDYPAEGCFCRRDGARSIYWAFYTLDERAWAYASLGAANTPVRDGAVHGWAWGLGDSSSGALPPVIDLATICGPAPAPTAAPPPAATALAAPSQAPPARPAPSPESGPQPTVAAPAPPTPAPAAPWGYLGFGALVLLLAVGAAILARRR